MRRLLLNIGSDQKCHLGRAPPKVVLWNTAGGVLETYGSFPVSCAAHRDRDASCVVILQHVVVSDRRSVV